MNRPILALALAAGGLSTAAHAGGMADPAPEVPVAAPVVVAQPSADWTGGWAGVRLGYGDASAGANDGSGATYGIAGGYDWDFGRWVAGAGLSWDKTDIDLGGAGDSLDSVTRLGFRVGTDLGRTFVYATAGAARASADIGGAGLDDNGWYGGLGADYAINDRWTVGGEILRDQFDNFGGSGTDIDATTASVNLGLRF